MSEQYFYVVNGKQNGPISFEELRELAVRDQLKRPDRIWCKGMEKWQPAGSIAELFDDLPPDLDGEDESSVRETPTTKATQSSNSEPSTTATEKTKSHGLPYWAWLILMAIVVYWRYKHHQYAGQ